MRACGDLKLQLQLAVKIVPNDDLSSQGFQHALIMYLTVALLIAKL
jgi:hypothetical protein